MSQRRERNAAAGSSFSDVQCNMREALQSEKADLLQEALTTSTAVLQSRGSDLLPLALELCDPFSARTCRLKKFGFLNVAWKFLLTIMTSEHIDVTTFEHGAMAMSQHLRTGVLSHDWTDPKKNKLATFFASHIVTTVRAHPDFVLRCPPLLEALTTLYYAVCVVLATSDRDDASLRPLYDHILTRLHVIFECLGGAAAEDCLAHPDDSVDDEQEAAKQQDAEVDGPSAAGLDGDVTKQREKGATDAQARPWVNLLQACVSASVWEEVTAEAGGGPDVEAATGLAAACAFLHATRACLHTMWTKVTTTAVTRDDPTSERSRADVRGLLLAQWAALVLAWLPGGCDDNTRPGLTAPLLPSHLAPLRRRIDAIAPRLPPSALTVPQMAEEPCDSGAAGEAQPHSRGGSEGVSGAATSAAVADGADASAPQRLWRTCFSTLLHALFHIAHAPPGQDPEATAGTTREADATTGLLTHRDDDRDQWLLYVLLQSLSLADVASAATVMTAWTDFVYGEEAERSKLLRSVTAEDLDRTSATNEEDNNTQDTSDRSALSALSDAVVHFSRLLCALMRLADRLLHVRALALRHRFLSAHHTENEPGDLAEEDIASWCVQLSTQLCTLVAAGCTCPSIQQPPSTLMRALSAPSAPQHGDGHTDQDIPSPCQAAGLADGLYAGIASTLECTVRAVPEEAWVAIASSTAVPTDVTAAFGGSLPSSPLSSQWLRDLAGALTGIGVKPFTSDLTDPSPTPNAGEAAWVRLQAAIQRAVEHGSGDRPLCDAEVFSSSLLSIPALLRSYRLAVMDDCRLATTARGVDGVETSAAKAARARLHADLVSHATLWKQLTELLQHRGARSDAPALACRYVAALLLRECAFLPLTHPNADRSHALSAQGGQASASVVRRSRGEEVLMVCLRRWLQLAIPESEADAAGGANCENEEAVGADAPVAKSCGLDIVALEAALSLLSFAEHRTDIPLHELRLSETASNALMHLLDTENEEGLSASSLSASYRGSESHLRACLFPTAAANAACPRLAPEAWEDGMRQALELLTRASTDTVSVDADSSDPAEDAAEEGAAAERAARHRSHTFFSIGVERYNNLMAELQRCRQTITTFLSAPKCVREPALPQRARSPLPAQRSFGDVLPHHLRSRRGGGGGRSPSCSQTPPGHPGAARSQSPPPPPAVEEASTAPEWADLPAQLRSLMALSAQALEALSPSPAEQPQTHAIVQDDTSIERAKEAITNTIPQTASVGSCDERVPASGDAPRRAQNTQPPAPSSPWESYSSQQPGHDPVKTEQPDVLSTLRTRTMPIVTLSSRSSPQASEQVDDDPEIIDVDM